LRRGRDAALVVLGLAVIGLLLSKFGTHDLVAALSRARPGALCVYGALTALVVLGHSLRWRLVARSLGSDPALGLLVQARLAGDAVGVLVPSGKVAGEPLRFALVRARCGDGPLTAAAVAIDRILEVLGNLACVLVYVAVFAHAHSTRMRGSGLPPLAVAAGLFVASVGVLIASVRRGFRPLAFLHGPGMRRRFPRFARWADGIERMETHLVRFFRSHPGAFARGLLASVCIEALVVLQYHTLLGAFEIHLELPTLLMALVTSGLVRLAPTPGGLGALEAGQVALLQMSSGRAELGLVVGIVMRLHEVLMVGAGFAALALRGLSPGRATEIVHSTSGPQR
jgi:uncharacterized protein (TIRG00374 family)